MCGCAMSVMCLSVFLKLDDMTLKGGEFVLFPFESPWLTAVCWKNGLTMLAQVSFSYFLNSWNKHFKGVWGGRIKWMWSKGTDVQK